MDEANILKLIRTNEEQNESVNLLEKLLENTYKDKLDPTIINTSSFVKNLWVGISEAIALRKIANSLLLSGTANTARWPGSNANPSVVRWRSMAG